MAGGFTIKEKISQFKDFLIKSYEKQNLDISKRILIFIWIQ